MAPKKKTAVLNSAGKRRWNPEWSQRRFTVRLSKEGLAFFTALARKHSVEAHTSVTVPDLLEQAHEEFMLVHNARLREVTQARKKKG